MMLFHRIFAGLTALLLAAVIVATVGTFLGFDLGSGDRNEVATLVATDAPEPATLGAITPCVETPPALARVVR